MRFGTRAVLALSLAVAAGVATGDATAQTHAEVWGGLAVGSHSATAAGLDLAPRLSFQALLLRRLTPRISAYGGYVRTGFGCEEGYCLDRSLTVVGNHGVLGVALGGDGPWLRAGALVGTTEVGSEGEPSDVGIGVLAAAGLTVGSGRLRVLPAVSYRWLSAGSGEGSEHAAALAAELGLRYRLGG